MTVLWRTSIGQSITTRAAAGSAIGRGSTASTMLNIAVQAPMPTARMTH